MAVNNRDVLQTWKSVSESLPNKPGFYLFTVQRTVKQIKKGQASYRFVTQVWVSGSGFLDAAYLPDCEGKVNAEGFTEYDSDNYVDVLMAWTEMPMPYGCNNSDDCCNDSFSEV